MTTYAREVLDCKSGKSVFRATVYLIADLCSYDICGPDYEDKDLDRLLRTRTYNMRKSKAAYTVGVKIAGKRVFARILSDDPAFVDLCDFHYAHGLRGLIVSRTDSRIISAKEHNNIEAFVKESFEEDGRLHFRRFSTRNVVRVLG